MTEYNLAIIGGGPGGYVAALEGARRGATVALVEAVRVGGVCLNRGCIPTKAMRQSAAVLLQAQEATRFGIDVGDTSFDYAKVIAFRQSVVEQLVSGVEFLLAKRKVAIYKGKGILTAKNTIQITNSEGSQEIQAKGIILATGSLPSGFAGVEIDNHTILDSDGLLALSSPPQSLVIIGAGAVGCEWAQIMACFGTKVTIVEALPHLLPFEDAEVGKLLERIFRKWGIAVHTNAALQKVTLDSPGITAHLANGESVSAEKLLLSVGRRPNQNELWDPKLQIDSTPKGIAVNKKMNTSAKGIYAIGDLVGGPLLAHKASAEGRIAAENALGGSAVMGYLLIPSCTFTFPEIASVGMSESQAQNAGIKIRVGSFPFRANGKALALGETEGFVKLIASADDEILLGGVIMGPHASDLIMEIAMGLRFGGNFPLMEQTIHPHPTLSEAVLEALGDISGTAVHKLKLDR